VTHDQKVALSLSDRIGVMNDGKVVQIGTSTDIYETPKTTFVASFMGATNIFPGRVVSRHGGRIELETEDGLRIFAFEPEDVRSEEIAGISVHPELMQITSKTGSTGPDDSHENNLFHGTITEVFYQGDFSELTISLKPANRPVTIHLNRGMEHGVQVVPNEDVIVRWNWNHSNILAG